MNHLVFNHTLHWWDSNVITILALITNPLCISNSMTAGITRGLAVNSFIQDSPKPEDENRKFIISYRLSDDMITIYEPPQRLVSMMVNCSTNYRITKISMILTYKRDIIAIIFVVDLEMLGYLEESFWNAQEWPSQEVQLITLCIMHRKIL